jgi:hypothetical protein
VDLHLVHYAMASDNGRDCARYLSGPVASSNITYAGPQVGWLTHRPVG